MNLPTVNLIACCLRIANAGRPVHFPELFGAVPGRFNPVRHLLRRGLIADVVRGYRAADEYTGARLPAYALTAEGCALLERLGVAVPPDATAARWIIDGQPSYMPELQPADPAPGGCLVDGVERLDVRELRRAAERLVAEATRRR